MIPTIQIDLIGSGKIKRRILQRHVKIITASIKELQRIKGRRKPLPSIRITKDQRVILNHWNDKGHPFTSHKIDKSNPTNTLRRILNSTTRWLKKSGTIKICQAIDDVFDLFTSNEFKLKNLRGLTPLSLDAFFYYDTRHINPIRKSNKRLSEELIKDYDKKRFLSWFKEGRRGSDYLEKKFSYFIEDKHPEISKAIEGIWCKYRGDGFTLRPRHINTIRRISKRVIKFGDANPEICPPLEVVNRMQYMFDQMNFKPKAVNYLSNDIFWQDQFPEELIRWGGHKRRDVVIP